MDIMSLAVLGAAAALCSLVVRQRTPELAVLLALTACGLLLWHTLPLLEGIREALEGLAELAALSPEILEPVMRTVGLSIVTRLAASLCRDAGEGGIAAFLEVAGSAAAVVVALPLLHMVLDLISDLL